MLPPAAAPPPLILSSRQAFVLPALPAFFASQRSDPSRCIFKSHLSGRHPDLLEIPFCRRRPSRRDTLSCSQGPGDPHRGERSDRTNTLGRREGTGTQSRSFWGRFRPAKGGVVLAVLSIMLAGCFPAELAHAKLTTTAETSPREVVFTLRFSPALLLPFACKLVALGALASRRLMGRAVRYAECT